MNESTTVLARPFFRRWMLGLIPLGVALAVWMVAPAVADIPPFMFPTMASVLKSTGKHLADGSLVFNVASSLGRLAIGFVIGNTIAIPLGIAIATNTKIADVFQPVLTFMQSIAGIAWVPLAIIWFGIGDGAVIFVIANTIFFSNIYNTVLGVRSIPPVLFKAARSHGASEKQILFDLVIPGALTQILVGMRTSMAFGWRALVGGEMLAGTSGIGYITIEAVQWYQTEIILRGMIIIGVLWLVMDRLIFRVLEDRTVQRWGMIQN